MILDTSLLGRHVHLMKDVVYDSVDDYGTYTYLSCRKYPDPWYNLIVPTTSFDRLDAKAALEFHASLSQGGITAGFYIKNDVFDAYNALFEKHSFKSMADDSFMLKALTNREALVNVPVIPLEDSYLEDYLDAAKVCFPNWPNNQELSEYFYDVMKSNPYKNKLFKTVVGIVDEKVVSYGSIILDLDVKLGYLHNAGTLADYRRQGFHTDMVASRCNFALENGVQQVVSITEQGSDSYKSLGNLGFKQEEQYHIFVSDSA